MTLIVCADLGDDCWNCGGWRFAAGGPCPGDDRYCSPECATEGQALADELARSDWCAECGYDRFEHALDCASFVDDNALLSERSET